MKFSKKLEYLEHSPIRKFYPYADEAEKSGKKVYYLNIGQPDIKTPSCYMEAVRKFDENVLEYVGSQGISPLISGIRDYYARLGVSFNNEDIMITQGGSEALLFTMLCITNEGDEVIIPEPFYSNYSIFVKGAGAKIVPLTTKAENGFHFADPKEIEKKITKRTKAILLTNPGNPTGTVLTGDEMAMIADIALKYDIMIISDEVYREFVYDGMPAASFGQYEKIADRVVLIDSISKRFSACGGRVGCVITRNRILQDHIMKLCQGRLSCSTLDQIGAAALYQLPQTYFSQVRDQYKKRRDLVFDRLSSIPGVVCQKPLGAFYITAKLPIKDAEDFLIFMLTSYSNSSETVMFAPARGFYETSGLGLGEIRLAYVLEEEKLSRAMDLLEDGLRQYQKHEQLAV